MLAWVVPAVYSIMSTLKTFIVTAKSHTILFGCPKNYNRYKWKQLDILSFNNIIPLNKTDLKHIFMDVTMWLELILSMFCWDPPEDETC